jgi:pimeloyl-ACP methyl ester carboxylesterase
VVARRTVDEHTIELGGAPVFFRRAPEDGKTILYLHSAPTSSDDWVPFLERAGGLAPDLPGFGRSGKSGHLEYTLGAYADFIENLLRELDEGDVVLVGHGWGAAAGLVFAQRNPHRIERLVLLDAVPLLEGFTWPAWIRWLRRPGLGELIMGSLVRPILDRILRACSVSAGAWSDERLDDVWNQFDQGTQRACLRLHRSIDPAGLARAGSDLDQLFAPALVVWGAQDRLIDSGFGDAYSQRLPRAELELVEGAGHWPWLDVPAVIDRVCAFAASEP